MTARTDHVLEQLQLLAAGTYAEARAFYGFATEPGMDPDSARRYRNRADWSQQDAARLSALVRVGLGIEEL